MESADRGIHHAVVAAAIVRGRKVLLCHRHPEREWYPNVWDVPGGHIENGESPLDALVREINEELGVEIDTSRAVSVLRSSPTPDLDIEVWAVADWTGEIVNAAPDEHDQLQWFVSSDLDTLAIAHPDIAGACRRAIKEFASQEATGEGQQRTNAETDEDIAAPILEPLVEAARGLGLDVHQPQVLGAGANVVVHLAPSPVVARVATLTAEMRGSARSYLRRERSITAALSARGMNTIAPTNLVDPGPHNIDGHEFLLIEHRPLKTVDYDSPVHAEMAGQAFARLSTALADLPATLDGLEEDAGHPWVEIATLTNTVAPTVDPVAMAQIAATTKELQDTETDDPWQLVHGDAHRNNVALLDNQIVWFDFEDANLRPLAWDLATLRRSWPAAGDAACRLLDVNPESPSMLWHHELRELYALLWSLLYAQRYVRHRSATADRLDGWMSAQ